MKCNIAKDLLPLYEEGLCSSDTAEEIREHLEGCPECRKLSECSLTAGKVPEPDEATAMKKVNRSFRRKKTVNRILAFLLGAVVLTTGVLTVGQALKVPYLPSFDTLISRHYAKRMVESLSNGYFDGFMTELSYDYMENVNLEGEFSEGSFADLMHKDAEAIKKAYNACYGNTKLKDYDLKVSYGDVIRGTEKGIMCTADLKYEDGRTQQLVMVKNTDGLYKAFTMKQDTDEEKKLSDTMMYVSLRNIWNTGGFAENAMIRDRELDTEKNVLESCFVSDGVTDRMNDLYSAGYRVTESVFSREEFDTASAGFFYKVSITAEDGKGSAVLNTRLYFDENGFYSPAEEDCTVIADGCGNDLIEKLTHFFG